jgi:hypothetical protein
MLLGYDDVGLIMTTFLIISIGNTMVVGELPDILLNPAEK